MSKAAFPHESHNEIFGGMSLLEYYAGQALIGLLASPTRDKPEAFVGMSFNIAEVMVKEAEKRSK